MRSVGLALIVLVALIALVAVDTDRADAQRS